MKKNNSTQEINSNLIKLVACLSLLVTVVVGVLLSNNFFKSGNFTNSNNQTKAKHQITNQEKDKIIKSLSGSYKDYKENKIVATSLELKYSNNSELTKDAYNLGLEYTTKEPEEILLNSTGVVENFIGSEEFNKIKSLKTNQIKEKTIKRNEIINLLKIGLFSTGDDNNIIQKKTETNLAIDKITKLIEDKECEDVFFNDKTFKRVQCDDNVSVVFGNGVLEKWKIPEDSIIKLNNYDERSFGYFELKKYYRSND